MKCGNCVDAKRKGKKENCNKSKPSIGGDPQTIGLVQEGGREEKKTECLVLVSPRRIQAHQAAKCPVEQGADDRKGKSFLNQYATTEEKKGRTKTSCPSLTVPTRGESTKGRNAPGIETGSKEQKQTRRIERAGGNREEDLSMLWRLCMGWLEFPMVKTGEPRDLDSRWIKGREGRE